MTLGHILIGLAGWTVIALVAGLFLGNALRFCARYDGMATMPGRPEWKKSA